MQHGELEVGQRLPVTITGLDGDGNGTARVERTLLHTPGVALGDVVELRVDHLSAHAPDAWGTVVRVEQRGPGFRKPPCPHAAPIRGACGGCSLMHLELLSQRAFKRDLVNEALRGLPGFRPLEDLERADGESADGLAYRNRGNFVVFRDAKDLLRLGSYAPRSHKTSPMEPCLVQVPVVEEVTRHVEQVLRQRNVAVYPARDGLRYVTVRATSADVAAVDLVIAQKHPRWLDAVVALIAEHPRVQGVSSSVNQSEGNSIRVAGSTMHVGSPLMVEQLGPLSLEVAATGFFQLNRPIAAAMYRTAGRWLHAPEVIWDLYCGVGGLGLTVLKQHPRAQLFGAELSPESVRLARRNARNNGVEARYEVADLGKGHPSGWPAPDTLLVNPPRKGLSPKVLRAIQQLRPQRLLYMSCSPESLGRDLRELVGARQDQYRVAQAAAWDMMPQTPHVEALVLLERIKPSQKWMRRS